jgi:pimeloyl-ACP methyl ester carboxylesterase
VPNITTNDGVSLYYEEAGQGDPLVFVHEFGGDHRSWEPQLRFFSRWYRCITFAARGYPPSDVPQNIEKYSQARAAADISDVVDSVAGGHAHIIGLSMGGFSALHFGLSYPDKARSLVVAGCGYGAEKQHENYFKGISETVAANFLALGSKNFAPTYATGASRVQFQNKDFRGWQEFARQLGEHSEIGAANTMRGVQSKRPSLYDLEVELRHLTTPTLVVSGDEDDHCLQPALYLKRVIPACGLLVLPKCGHTINLEEPTAFNAFIADFLRSVEHGKWTKRDPRADPAQIMRTD